MNIVTIGGGTGQYHVLRALMLIKEKLNLKITAIPTTIDSGGSSGLLRGMYHIIAPGDIGQCIFGLHPKHDHVSWLFQHRFNGAGVFEGHTSRNMIVAAAFEQLGMNQQAIDAIGAIFELEDHITPVTFSESNLHALLGNGTELKSEEEIYCADIIAAGGLKRFWLEPDPEPNEAALLAIEKADAIVICPGTIFCSIVPNLLVNGMREQLCAAKAQKICVTNLMNRHRHVPSESTVLDHVEYIEEYLEEGFFSVVIANSQRISPVQKMQYEEEAVAVPPLTNIHDTNRVLFATPLLLDTPSVASQSDSLAHLRAIVRHSPEKLGYALDMALGMQSGGMHECVVVKLDRSKQHTHHQAATLS